MGRLEQLTLDQLRMVVAVAQEGSFTAAGRRLGRAQSTVSHAVAKAEDILGVELFVLEGRTPEPTPGGAVLIAQAVELLGGVERLYGSARRLRDGGGEAELTVAWDARVAPELVAPLCAELAEAHGDVQPQMRVGSGEDILGWVDAGEVRAGVTLGSASGQEGQVQRVLGTLALTPVIAADHPDRDTPTPPSTLAYLGPFAAPPGAARSRAQLSLDRASQHALLSAGLGWALLPATLAAQLCADGRFVQLPPAWGATACPVYACWRRDDPPGPVTRWALDRISAMLADAPTPEDAPAEPEPPA